MHPNAAAKLAEQHHSSRLDHPWSDLNLINAGLSVQLYIMSVVRQVHNSPTRAMFRAFLAQTVMWIE